jgi:hypothetical protein
MKKAVLVVVGLANMEQHRFSHDLLASQRGAYDLG